MTINEIKDAVYKIMYSIGAGSLAPNEFNSYSKQSENELFEHEYKQFEETNQISDILNAFKSEQIYLGATADRAYPSDYRHSIAFIEISPITGKDIRAIKETPQDKFTILANSDLIPIEECPIIKRNKPTSFSVLPITTRIRLEYFKIPIYAVWGFTLVDNRPVYNPSASTQSSFPEFAHVEIIRRILAKAGAQLQKDEILQYAQMQSQDVSTKP
jgi:hypothetical protein